MCALTTWPLHAATSPIVPNVIKVMCDSADLQGRDQAAPPFSHAPVSIFSSLLSLLTKIARRYLLNMNEHNGFKVLTWDASTLITWPHLLSLLVAQLPALRDTTDTRCKAICVELLVRSMGGTAAGGGHQD